LFSPRLLGLRLHVEFAEKKGHTMPTVHHHEPPYSVGYFVGSLAKGSINRTLSRALIRLAPDDLEFTEIPIRDLPLYNHDCDVDYPPEARALKQSIESVDAVLFVTPEYNRAIPGGLKNAIDWASRPWGENSFEGKPSAVIGGSVGAIGTAIAQQNLRSVLSFCNSPHMNSPEAYLQISDGLITDDGTVTNDDTADFLRQYMTAYLEFITRVLTVIPRS
jgi:chromate reductase